MANGTSNSPKGGARVSRRTALITGAVVVAVLLVVAGVAGIVAANRAPSSGPATATVATGASRDASQSTAATGSATATTTTATVTTDTAGGSASGAGDPTTARPKATPPSRTVLDALKPGEWQLYGSRVTAHGAELKRSDSTDVQGITIECEAMTKSGGGYAHASMEIAFSATGPASGNGGPWSLFGTWVLDPNDGAKDSQHYGQGLKGSMSGRSTVRPPTRSGKIVAGFSPIGAYRPNTGGVIRGGEFVGNAVFEGVLRLPGLAVPPPSKK
jgi:hypothetical protein